MGAITPFPVTDREVSHVVIEMFGGDNNLSSFVLEDLQEMAAGNAGAFSTLALLDFEDKGGQVVELSPRTGHRVVASLGEIDTGDPRVLAEFIARALVSYPADTRKALGFWDHGTGVFDEHDANEHILTRRLNAVARRSRSRSRPARRLFVPRAALAAHPRLRAMLHDDTNGGVLTNYEAWGVLTAAWARAGIPGKKIDMIFSDTCLNGMIEVLEQFRDFAHVVVGSEDLEPGDGWDYQRLFRAMTAQPPRTPDEWGAQAVKAFEDGYAHRPAQHPCTLGAFRTDQKISEAVAACVKALDPYGRTGFTWVQEARMLAQSFARHDTYDIRDFFRYLAEAAPAEAASVKQASANIVAAFDAACVAATALGDTVSQARGLAFWVPSNRTALNDVRQTYAKLKFDELTDWTKYLTRRFTA